MLKQVMDFTGDTFPLLLTMLFGFTVYCWGMHYTRDLCADAEEKRTRASAGRKQRARIAHKSP